MTHYSEEGKGKEDPEVASRIRERSRNMAPTRDDVEADIQPQTRPFSHGFSGEEWAEKFLLDIFRHTWTRIFDINKNPIASLLSAYGYAPLSFHGVHGVINDVCPDLVEFTPICLDPR